MSRVGPIDAEGVPQLVLLLPDEFLHYRKEGDHDWQAKREAEVLGAKVVILEDTCGRARVVLYCEGVLDFWVLCVTLRFEDSVGKRVFHLKSSAQGFDRNSLRTAEQV